MLCAVRARLRSGPAAPDDGPLTASPPFPRTHRTLLPPPPPPPLPPSRDMKPPRHAVYSLAAYLLPLLLFDFLWPRRQLPAAAPSFPRCPPTCVFARAHLRVCMQICDVMRMRIDKLLTNTRARTHTHTHTRTCSLGKDRLVAELILGLAVYDFLFFWIHLAMHKIPALSCARHAQHHSNTPLEATQVGVYVYERGRERQRQRDRETERQRDRETER